MNNAFDIREMLKDSLWEPSKAGNMSVRDYSYKMFHNASCPLCRWSHLFLRNSALMIPKEGTPATTAEHERLHERPFGLDRMHQIVSGPRMKHFCQGDCAQLRMLCGSSQIVVLHLLEQNKTFLTISCERSSQLLRCL